MQINNIICDRVILCIESEMMNLLNTKQAAEKLNISAIRVRQLIREGRLAAQLVGRDYVIKESDLKLVQDRKTGRPPKTS
jgi:excisionase family DNA binding protein